MTRLKKITVSNIRRFAEDVEIDLSEGATIILAPNGTGKTSIFEAIEFALTGTVRRLGHPPTPIIRDRFESAKIRLDFEQDQFCEVNFHKDGNPIIRHEHSTLFNRVEKDNIPYLLRLTHLLNQSNKEWFVQSKSDEAASQLDSLSIGKDATIANSSMVSLKRAAGSIVEKLQQEFEKIDAELAKWNELLEKRKNVISPSNQNLTPRIQIIDQIVGIETGLFPQGLVDEIPVIKSTISQLQSRYIQTEIVANSKITSLSQLRAGVASYSQLSNERTQLERAIGEKSAVISGIDGKIAQNTDLVEETLKKSTEKHSDIQQRHTIKGLGTQIVELTNKLPAFEQDKKNAESDESRLHKELQGKSDEANIIRSKITAAQNLNRDKLQLSERKRQHSELSAILEKWTLAESQCEQLDNSRVSVEARLATIDGKLSPLEITYQGKQNVLRTAEDILNGLVSSSGKLKAAVSQVASYLPTDAKECPVCNTQFEQHQLQDEIGKSLSKIDAGLQPAHTAVRKAKQEVDEMQKEVEKLRDDKENASKEIQQINRSIQSLKFQVESECRSKFEGKSIEVARDDVQMQGSELEALQREIGIKEIELGDLPPQSIQESVDAEVTLLQQRVNTAKEKQRNATFNIEVNTGEIEKLRNRLQQYDYAENDIKLAKAEESYAAINIQLQKLQEALKSDNFQLELEKGSLSASKAELQRLSSRQDEIFASWQLAELPGAPDLGSLENALRAQRENVGRCKDCTQLLARLMDDVVKWEAYESYFTIESNIRDVIGKATESDYASSIKGKHEKQRLRLESAKSKVGMINTFSRNLDTELKTVNEKLASINPIWNKILKRLVIDPRFASTALNNYQSYRKNYAEVKVPLHNTGALVSQVASEAQITDIQFSFLLAMAQMYQWCPWRALLLDDPTQHHDLVHASAVFDLLRDYIADYKFQVLMATHDTVQAKFFRRKLENDGIPCSFYALNATRGGVIAERQ